MIQLAMTLFHVGIALATIYPRLPSDLPFPKSIGGDLSHPFRKILLGLTLLNVIRLFTFSNVNFDGVTGSITTMTGGTTHQLVYVAYLVSSAIESFFRSFLCLLTPYLMQCQLQNRINIRRPGLNLMIWVYLVLFFNILGCIMVEVTGNPKYWGIKKLGDALSFPPVYKTLKLYSSIMTQGGRFPGRGDMTGQTLTIVEYLAVTATLLSAFGYIGINDPDPKAMMASFRVVGSFANMTRVLCHAMLMNSKDEAHYLNRYSTAAASTDDAEDDAEDDGFGSRRNVQTPTMNTTITVLG